MPKNDQLTTVAATGKSLLDNSYVTLMLKGAPVIKELVPLFSLLVNGVQDTNEQKQLREIYSRLGRVDANVRGVSSESVYLKAANELRTKVSNIYDILNNGKWETLVEEQLTVLCNFLTIGSDKGYRSYINALLDAAYGFNLASALNATPEAPCAIGSGKTAVAAFNDSLLTSSIGVLEYLREHKKFAEKIAELSLAVCLAVKDTYEFLNNEAAIENHFKNKTRTAITKIDVEAILANSTVKADVLAPESPNLLFARLTTSLGNAPAALCGLAYTLVKAMQANAKKAGSGYTNISISRKEGYVAPGPTSNFYGGSYTILGHKLEYSPTPVGWVVSFSNDNAESDYINLAGRNGGFLGLVDGSKSSYAYELKSDKLNSIPAHKWDCCIWQLKVMHDQNKNMVFMLKNKQYPEIAFANNHGFMIHTAPGHYQFKEDNPDEYWTIKLL